MSMSKEIKIDPLGFREYDARWIYEKGINKLGIENLGKGLGTQIIKHTKKNNPRVIVGQEYRSYSEELNMSLNKENNYLVINEAFDPKIIDFVYKYFLMKRNSEET